MRMLLPLLVPAVAALVACSESSLPTPPPAEPLRAALIAANQKSTCALAEDGGVLCWGVRIGGVSCFDGCLDRPTPVSAATPFDTIVAGGIGFGSAMCALPADGVPHCWGRLLVGIDQGHRLGPAPAPLENPVPLRTIDVGLGHICGVAYDGATRCWGDYDGWRRGQDTVVPGGIGIDFVPNVVRGGHAFAAVQASVWATCGLEPSGQVRCWGAGFLLGNATAPLIDDHNACGFGNPCSPDPLPIDGNFTIARFASQEACAISDAAELVCWGGRYGDPRRAPAVIPLPVPVTDAVAGDSHRCALAVDGAAWCWGSNADGQLGVGSVSHSDAPVPVAGGLTFRMLAAGSRHTCGLTPEREVYCWGSNESGQIGNGSRRIAWTPVRVEG